jgi:hypothetical protein
MLNIYTHTHTYKIYIICPESIKLMKTIIILKCGWFSFLYLNFFHYCYNLACWILITSLKRKEGKPQVCGFLNTAVGLRVRLVGPAVSWDLEDSGIKMLGESINHHRVQTAILYFPKLPAGKTPSPLLKTNLNSFTNKLYLQYLWIQNCIKLIEFHFFWYLC